MELLECLFEMMIKNGLKLSPKKSQLFMKELVYLETLFRIQGNNMKITPLHTRIDAIMNVPIPNTPHLCRSFCGMVNYISMFCPKLQELLKPIHDLTRKGQKFLWTDNHTKIFEEIKKQLCKPPVLHFLQQMEDSFFTVILADHMLAAPCGKYKMVFHAS